jgi:hypothetical protein
MVCWHFYQKVVYKKMFSHRNGRTEKVPTPPLDYTILRFSMAFMVFPCTNMLAYIWYTMVSQFLILCTLSMFFNFHVTNNLCFIDMFGTTLQQTRIANWKTTMLHSLIYQWCRICPKLFGGFLKWGYPPIIIHFFQGFSMKEPSSPVPWDLVGTSDFGHASMVALNSPSPD